jgi:ketosteroid isomerase-like protein
MGGLPISLLAETVFLRPKTHVKKEIKSMTTQEILQHHMESIGAGNVDQILNDYTEESVILTAEGAIKGREKIRELFENFTTHMLPPGSDFELIQQLVDGDVAYVVWKAESALQMAGSAAA